MARTIATVEPEECEGRPGRVFATPYNPGWLEEMKATVPRRERRYWSETKAWWVAEDFAEAVIELTVRVFDEAEIVDPDTGECIHRTKEGHVRQEGLFG